MNKTAIERCSSENAKRLNECFGKRPKAASERYSEQAARIEQQLVQLQERLAAHHARQAADPRNWGYVGNAAHVATKLDELLQFLGD